MNKKIIGILVMTLLIATALSATGATNVQTLEYLMENNELEPYPSNPVDSNGNIAIKIVGEVTNVEDSNNLLGGAINVGDKIKGKYIYDSGTVDTYYSYPGIGFYEHTTSPFGIELKAGGFVFKTDPNDVNFLIAIFDNSYFYNDDLYAVISYDNLKLSNGIQVDDIVWLLLDSTGNALSSDALPTTAPVLSDWSQNELYIDGYDPSNPLQYFEITATVTKATLSRNKARDAYFTMQPIFIWLFERFPNLFPILRQILTIH